MLFGVKSSSILSRKSPITTSRLHLPLPKIHYFPSNKLFRLEQKNLCRISYSGQFEHASYPSHFGRKFPICSPRNTCYQDEFELCELFPFLSFFLLHTLFFVTCSFFPPFCRNRKGERKGSERDEQMRVFSRVFSFFRQTDAWVVDDRRSFVKKHHFRQE